MKKIVSVLITLTMLVATSCSASSKDTTKKDTTSTTKEETIITTTTASRIYPDNAFVSLDNEYTSNNWAPEGSVVRFEYETKDHLSNNDKTYKKSALVYLPACYDENDTETKYNVMYLMHGGSDKPEWFFGFEGGYSKITRMIDSMIEKGEIEPLIICAVSYYTDYCSDATTNCKNFYIELTKDVMPAFETEYHTYAEGVTDEDFIKTRRHRAFGGFSMGAVTTWSVFEHCLDKFAYFVPISGDCWALGGTAGGSQSTNTAAHLELKVLESGYTAKDFYIYAGCGGYDIAKPNLMPQIDAMKLLTDTFIYCENFADGNLYHCLYEKGGHDFNTVLNIMHNGLPKMFG